MYNMKTMKQFLLAGAIALTAATLTTACSDKNDDEGGGTSWDAGKIAGSVAGTWWGTHSSDATVTIEGTTLYGEKDAHAYVFKSDGTGTVYKYLVNVAGEPIAIYGGSMDAQNGAFTYTTNADSTITITRTGNGDSDNPKTWKAALTKDGLKVLFGSQQFGMNTATDYQEENITEWEKKLRTGSNEEIVNESFLTNWMEVEQIELADIGKRDLPWGTNGQAPDIPYGQRFYNYSKEGWEMAFCKLNDDTAPDVHYFGLYNKLTGVLRVFFYVKKASDYGNQLLFNLISESNDELKYPLYNAMEFGVPANHTIGGKNLSSTAYVTSATGTSKAWQWYLTPYRNTSDNNGVQTGWHCVDFDMSGYVPGGKDWLSAYNTKTPLFSIYPISKNTQTIDLTGSITGSISGTTEETKAVQTSSQSATASGISQIFSSISSTCQQAGMAGMMMSGGGGGGNTRQYEGPAQAPVFHAPTRVAVTAVLAVVGIVASVASAISAAVAEASTTTEEVYDTTTGKVDLNVDCNVNLSGTMSGYQSVTDAGVELSNNLISKANADTHFGQGNYSLADDPVIYIDKEDLMANTDHYKIRASSSGATLSDFADTDTRIVWMLDPNSIKINLNNDLYHNIKDMEIDLAVAVQASRSKGHTDDYRQNLLKLDARPTFKLTEKTQGTVELNGSSTPRLVNLTADTLQNYDKSISEAEAVLYDQTSGNDIRFYGKKYSFGGVTYMMDPQVYVPYDGSTIKDAEAPDFYVAVSIYFKCDEGEIYFVKQFIPKVELVTRDEMKTKYSDLKTYIQKSKDGEAVGTVANKSSVSYTAPDGYKNFNKTAEMLKRVLGE